MEMVENRIVMICVYVYEGVRVKRVVVGCWLVGYVCE